MRVVYGLLFVFFVPVVRPFAWVATRIRNNYNDGTSTYDWNKRIKSINKSES